MALPLWLGSVLEPVGKIIDSINAPQEERGKMRLALLESQIALTGKVLEYEVALVNAQQNVIVAEAKGESALQRSWRPAIMVLFGVVIGWTFLIAPVGSWLLAAMFPSVTPPPVLPIPERMWTLLELGIGGYIAGRSLEKITDKVMDKGLTFRKDEPVPPPGS